MSERVRISCINKPDRTDPFAPILFVGGIHNGKRWKLSQKDTIDAIKKGTWDFFVDVDGKEVDVVVETDRYGNEYIRTTPDATRKNNLLSLPECP